MDAESAVIQQQMEETRSSLTEKLETIEQQVADTVQEAGAAVSDSMGTMKETVDSVQETVATVKESVEETVAAVRETMESAVANVTESVQDTVTSIKDTFDIPLQVRRHPWAMTGVAVFVGYLIGASDRKRSAAPAQHYYTRRPWTDRMHAQAMAPAHEESNRSDFEQVSRSDLETASPMASESHWLSGIAEALAPEMAKLQGLAVGTLASLVRNSLTAAAPPQLKPQLAEIIDNVTTRLGGVPVEGSPFK